MPLFWNVSFEYERALCWPSCPPCSFLSWFHDESLCRVFWQFSMFGVDITSGSHGISNSSFPSKHSSVKINFFIATWTKVVERPFFLPDDVLGTTKKNVSSLQRSFDYVQDSSSIQHVTLLRSVFSQLKFGATFSYQCKMTSNLKLPLLQNDIV